MRMFIRFVSVITVLFGLVALIAGLAQMTSDVGPALFLVAAGMTMVVSGLLQLRGRGLPFGQQDWRVPTRVPFPWALASGILWIVLGVGMVLGAGVFHSGPGGDSNGRFVAVGVGIALIAVAVLVIRKAWVERAREAEHVPS
jgi:hypothetical protein